MEGDTTYANTSRPWMHHIISRKLFTDKTWGILELIFGDHIDGRHFEVILFIHFYVTLSQI